MVGIKTVTYAKISPQKVNPRDVSGERRRRRSFITVYDIWQKLHDRILRYGWIACTCSFDSKPVFSASYMQYNISYVHLGTRVTHSVKECPMNLCALHPARAGFFRVESNQWFQTWHSSLYPCQAPGVIESVLELVRYAVTGWDWKLDLQLLPQCGSMLNCQSRSVPEIQQHVAWTLSNQPTNKTLRDCLFVCWLLNVPATG